MRRTWWCVVHELPDGVGYPPPDSLAFVVAGARGTRRRAWRYPRAPLSRRARRRRYTPRTGGCDRTAVWRAIPPAAPQPNALDTETAAAMTAPFPLLLAQRDVTALLCLSRGLGRFSHVRDPRCVPRRSFNLANAQVPFGSLGTGERCAAVSDGARCRTYGCAPPALWPS